MIVPYDRFTDAFLSKVTEYDFVSMDAFTRNHIIDGYMKRALSAFKHICEYDFTSAADDNVREFVFDDSADDNLANDMDEIADIVSEGMVVQWLKPYTYKQENLQNALNTKDFTTYSPAELLKRICETHNDAAKRFTSMQREYSYNHGDLTDLHL